MVFIGVVCSVVVVFFAWVVVGGNVVLGIVCWACCEVFAAREICMGNRMGPSKIRD